MIFLSAKIKICLTELYERILNILGRIPPIKHCEILNLVIVGFIRFYFQTDEDFLTMLMRQNIFF